MADEYYSGSYTGAEIDAGIAAAMAAMPRTEAEAALAGKQATLTTEQQAAADSGITSAKVTQYDKDSAVLPEVVDRGAKNLFKAEAPGATSQNGATITDNGDGTYGVTTNGNPTTAAVWVTIGTVTLADGIYIMTGGADSEKCLIAVSDDGAVKYVGPGTTTISGAGTTGKQLYIHVPSGKSISGTLTVKPMICTQADYDASSTYIPYALPNPIITPATIGLVDKGAKNLLNIPDGTVTNYQDYPITLGPGEYIIYLGTLTSASESTIRIAFYKVPNYVIGTAIEVKNNTFARIIVPSECDTMRIFPTESSVTTTGKSVSFTNFMLCSKAAWDVSQKYVAYCPTMAELYEMIKALQA